VKDDIVDDKNTNTPELIEDTIEWDASTIPLFDDPEDPSNEEVVIGTPWHRADLYSLKSADPEYLVYIRHALEATDGTPDFSAGLPIFPERLSRDRLEKIRDRIANDELFFCQYMCDPRGGEASQFRREWIQTFDGEPEGDLTYALTVDPGSLRPDDGDFTAYVVCAVDVHSNLYVVHRVAARHNPREIINTIFDIYAQFQLIHSVGIEEVAYQKTLQFFAQEEMRRRGVWLPFVHLHTDTRVSKEMRIRSMIPRFSNLSMFIRPHMMDLKNQLLDFPKGRHDDLIDALAYQLQLIRTPQVKVNVVVDPFSLEEILKELADRKHGPGTLLRSNLVDAYVQPVRMYDLKDVN
jgi:predicted phage terminase large subunit-like protein